jgi:hypothetical protein
VKKSGEIMDVLLSAIMEKDASGLAGNHLPLNLPHRSPEEQHGIVSCFAGVTTWLKVCKTFNIDCARLPDITEEDYVSRSQQSRAQMRGVMSRFSESATCFLINDPAKP